MTKYTVSEAAPLIGVSESTLYTLVNQRKITHLRIGGKILFRQQDIDDFLNGCVVEREETQPALSGLKHIKLP
jgi:excisionase family DNA binding protein